MPKRIRRSYRKVGNWIRATPAASAVSLSVAALVLLVGARTNSLSQTFDGYRLHRSDVVDRDGVRQWGAPEFVRQMMT